MFKTQLCEKISKFKQKSNTLNRLNQDEKVLLDSFIEDNRELLKTLARM